MIAVHHLVADLWSLEILFEELAALYAQEIGGGPASLPEPQGSYAEYATRQKELSGSEKERRDLEYLARPARGCSAADLPTDYPRAAVETFDGGVQRSTIVPALLAQAKQLAG